MALTPEDKKRLIRLFAKAVRSGEALIQDTHPAGHVPGIDRSDPEIAAQMKDVLDYHKFLKSLMADL